MKTLTLLQPWATLVALEAKRIETRSWYTTYRGPLAIHAARRMSKAAISLCWEAPFRDVLETGGYHAGEPTGRAGIFVRRLHAGTFRLELA